MQTRTVVDELVARAQERPERALFTHLLDGERTELRQSQGEVEALSRRVAAGLAARLPRGARALLLLPQGPEFPLAFLGSLRAGVVAVPTNPPGLRRPEARSEALVQDARAAAVVTSAKVLARKDDVVARAPGLGRPEWITIEELLEQPADAPAPPRPRPDDLAVLQYTSGSTGAPKGVAVTHANLVCNAALMRACLGSGPNSVFVSWLPFHHDMGLMGKLVQTLLDGARCVFLTPAHFLERPLRWLEAVSAHRGTITGVPNFALDLCARRAADGEALEGLDLASVERLFCGSEPVRAETLARFAEAFAPCGLRREVLKPAYGLAEATLVVSFSRGERPPRVLVAERAALDGAGRLALAAEGARAGTTKTLVSCGAPADGLDVRIVDPASARALPDGELGEVWVAGENVARGYWERPEESEAVFGACLADGSGPYLRTGDLAVRHAGELWVAGRLKDLIVLRGENVPPQDVESACVDAHPALRAEGAAAFGADLEGTGGETEERLVLVHELRRPGGGDCEQVCAALRAAVARALELDVAAIALLPPGALPKTTSGKVKRREARARFEAGTLGELFLWRAPRAAGADDPQPVDAPASRDPEALVAWLARLVGARLGVAPESLDARAPLAALGLDSLHAAWLFARVGRGLSVELSIASLLEGASLVELAREIAALPREEDAGGADPADAGAPAPGERALVYLQRLAPESAAWNLALALRVPAELGSDAARALEGAWARLVRRHDALRTSFPEERSGAPARRVASAVAARLERSDARALSDVELRARLAERTRRPFDLARAPLARAALFERASEPPVLLLEAHHAIADHASFAVLVDELLALAHDPGAPLPPAPSLSVWVRGAAARATEARRDADAAFWRERLAELPEPLDLPADHPRPAARSFRGRTLRASLSAAAAEALRARARALGATPFLVALTAFELWLARVSGRERFLLGTLASGRDDARAEGLVGYLVRPLVLRAELADDPSFAAALERVRVDASQALRHATLPFDELVERLRPARDAGRSPLFDVLFVWQELRGRAGADLAALPFGRDGDRIAVGAHAWELVGLDEEGAQFDLSLSMGEDGRGLALVLEGDRALFSDETLARFLAGFARLLVALARGEVPRASALDLASADERARIRTLADGPPAAPGAAEPLWPRLARALAVEPERVALVAGGARVTRGELAARSGRIAAALAARGVSPGDVVALHAGRSVALVAGILAVLRRGAAWQPLDPAWPEARRAELAGDARARVTLSRADLEALAARSENGPEDGPAGGHAGDVGVPAHPLQPAYVLHTSGSTGRPKGVLVPERALATHVAAALARFELTPDDCVLHMAAVGFDLAIEELLPPLAAGARVVVHEAEAPPSFLELEELVRAEGLTVLDLPTAYWHAWARARAEERPARELAPSLRLVIVGGERASGAALDAWRASGAAARWINTYGPTEATVTATAFEPAGDERFQGRAIPVGRPIAGYRALVLDRSLHPLPPGLPGELALGGPGLALAYAGDPRRTAERFVPDPLGGGGRLYRTGDRARQGADGALTFLGRLDDEVKVRGFRVAPAEVVAALEEHPSVAVAAVLPHTYASGTTRLLVWATPRAGALDEDALRAHLAARLPAHLVPDRVRAVDALPRTRHGKLDKEALLALAEEQEEAPTPGADAPLDERESALAAIFAEVLGVARVGRHDDFFALGGDSIQSLQVAARAARAGLALGPADLLRHRTLAAVARAARSAPVTPVAPAAVAEGASGPVPLTPIQRWFFEHAGPEPAHWNFSLSFELRGVPPDAARLRALLGVLVRRHDALRLRFAETADGWRARVASAAEAEVPVDQVAVASEAEEQAALARAQAGLDLAAGPLFRAVSMDRADGGAPRLCLVVHHLAVDAVSWRVLGEELEALLAGGPDAPLPPPPCAWRAWAERAEALARAPLAAELLAWRDALARVAVRDAHLGVASDERELTRSLPTAETAALLEAARALRATPEELLVTAVARALAGEDGGAVLLELETHGRDLLGTGLDLASTVGWFTALHPLLVELSPSDGADETVAAARALARVKDALRAVPGGRAAWSLARFGGVAAHAAALGGLPSAVACVNWLGKLALGGGARLVPAAWGPPAQRAPSSPRTHRFEVDAWMEGGALSVRWLANARAEEPGHVEALCARVLRELASFACPRADADAAALAPSDFPSSGLDAAGLAKVLSRLAPRSPR